MSALPRQQQVVKSALCVRHSLACQKRAMQCGVGWCQVALHTSAQPGPDPGIKSAYSSLQARSENPCAGAVNTQHSGGITQGVISCLDACHPFHSRNAIAAAGVPVQHGQRFGLCDLFAKGQAQ